MTGSSFHTLVFRSGGQDVISLLASDATFDSTNKTFTWSNISEDPFPSGGTVTFVFQESGSGLAAYGFAIINSGLTIETYGNKDYLHIGSAANVANGDTLLVQGR